MFGLIEKVIMFCFNGKNLFNKNTLSAEKWFEKGEGLVDGIVIIDGTDIFRAGFWGGQLNCIVV